MHVHFDTVVFTDKPAISRLLAPHLAEHYDPRTTLLAHLLLAGPGRFDYPRGLPLSAYPVIGTPVYRLDTSHTWLAHPLESLVDENAHQNSASRLPNEVALAAIRGAKTFVFAGNPCGSSIHAFEGTLALLHPRSDPSLEHRAYVLSDLSNATMAKAVATPTTTASFRELAGQCVVKRYFEWNWNLNALVLFGRALRAAGASPGSAVSKYGLQVLYHLDSEGAMPENRLFCQMHSWAGTGKYPPGVMGSSTSYDAIMGQLQNAGLVVRGLRLVITPVGKQFLAMLHPGCRDADLPARLQNWMQMGLAAAKPAMDRYLRTLFGRQSRFQAPVSEPFEAAS